MRAEPAPVAHGDDVGAHGSMASGKRELKRLARLRPSPLVRPPERSWHYSGVRLIRRTNQPLPCPAAGSDFTHDAIGVCRRRSRLLRPRARISIGLPDTTQGLDGYSDWSAHGPASEP